MEIKPIKTKADHRAALKEIETLMAADYEVLSSRRPLTLSMIRRLHSELGIPAESLIKQPEKRRAA